MHVSKESGSSSPQKGARPLRPAQISVFLAVKELGTNTLQKSPGCVYGCDAKVQATEALEGRNNIMCVAKHLLTN